MSAPPAVRIVLGAMERHGVRALLMGGQACVAYGASELTRDIDLVVLADDASLAALESALRELQADVIAVPAFDRAMLDAGHAVHFRCRAPGVDGIRVDVMSRLRGVDAFPRLWERRVVLANGMAVLSLPDLVAAKKTQRDKDWPMIRRLIEADYFARRETCTRNDLEFWLRECRTPALLLELAARHPDVAAMVERPAVVAARRDVAEHSAAERDAAESEITTALQEEESAERAADAAYWAPLRRQLEEMRRQRRS